KSSIYYGDFSFQSGIEGMKVLKEKRPESTAVFTVSDLVALGVLNFAFRNKIRIPEDLAVIGFDDTEDALMSIPPLTTVHQPIEEMGRLAAEMILKDDIPFESHILDHFITERSSV
ncbi:MAG: substrate-binding domain-containing protein, partial [Spirochaetaceae bacterium]|nr:substrate-binding domain-containing protein [Spirochaetaceae bacterium]